LRYSKHRLNYLLYPQQQTESLPQPSAEVVPETGITALHWSLLSDERFETKQEQDPETKDEIFRIILDKYYDDDEIVNAQTTQFKQTALHIAADAGNLKAVKLLIDHAEADISIKNFEGKTPLEVAKDELGELIKKGQGVQAENVRKVIAALESEE